MEKMDKTTSASNEHSRRETNRGGGMRSGAISSTRAGDKSAPEAQDADRTDALDVLKEQHREVKHLFAEFKRAEDDDSAWEVALVICEKLTVHATIEEEIFYPAVRAKEELKDMVLEALEEHQSVKRLISDIEETEAGDETLNAKLTVLEEQVTHHVKEEESELFPKVRKEIPKEERRALGQQLLQRTQALQEQEQSEDEEPEQAAKPDKPGSREARTNGAAAGSARRPHTDMNH